MRVWGEENVRFTGNKFGARVDNNGKEHTLCIPVIYDNGVHCGVAIITKNEVFKWGMFAPRDYIASWRAGEILRSLGLVNQATVRGAFYAASRSLNTEEEKHCTAPIIKGIGGKEYKSIMSLPIPEGVVRAILHDRKHLKRRPNLYPLTEEVEAGTLAWRNEFSEAGVLTPARYSENKKRWEEIERETIKHLDSLTSSINLKLEDIETCEVQGILVMLFGKKAHENHPPYALVAIATVMSEAINARMSSFARFEMFEKVCQWVSRTSGYPSINLFNVIPMKKEALSPQEVSELLQELTIQYFPGEKNLMGL